MDNGRATVLLSFHRTGHAAAFAAYADAIGTAAAASRGFTNWRLSVLTSQLLEWAVTVSFDSEQNLHDWLDHAGDVLRGRGYHRAALELLAHDVPVSPGVLLVQDLPAPGHDGEYVETAEHLAQLERIQPGYEGSSVLPPTHEGGKWSSFIRFRTDRQLHAWMYSNELTGALHERQPHLTGDTQVATATATTLGSTVRVSNGQAVVTPAWKTALLVQLVLYPAVMLLGRFVNPWLATLTPQPWLLTFVSLAISVVLLTWVLMPLTARMFGAWLDPVAGAARRPTVLGTVAVLAGYALFLGIFAVIALLHI